MRDADDRRNASIADRNCIRLLIDRLLVGCTMRRRSADVLVDLERTSESGGGAAAPAPGTPGTPQSRDDSSDGRPEALSVRRARSP